MIYFEHGLPLALKQDKGNKKTTELSGEILVNFRQQARKSIFLDKSDHQ